jgi:hypothetical protein
MAASLAMSADVLHQIAPVAGLDDGLTKEEIYKKLSKRITVNVGKQDKLLNISTLAKSPEAAQKLNQALLDTLFPLSKPRGLEKAAGGATGLREDTPGGVARGSMTPPPISPPGKVSPKPPAASMANC